MLQGIHHIPLSPLFPPTGEDTWLKTGDELIYCEKQIWVRWSSLHLWSTNPLLSLDNPILDHCKHSSSFNSPLFLFQLKSLIEKVSPERAAGSLPPGAGTWTRKDHPLKHLLVWPELCPVAHYGSVQLFSFLQWKFSAWNNLFLGQAFATLNLVSEKGLLGPAQALQTLGWSPRASD